MGQDVCMEKKKNFDSLPCRRPSLWRGRIRTGISFHINIQYFINARGARRGLNLEKKKKIYKQPKPDFLQLSPTKCEWVKPDRIDQPTDRRWHPIIIKERSQRQSESRVKSDSIGSSSHAWLIMQRDPNNDKCTLIFFNKNWQNQSKMSKFTQKIYKSRREIGYSTTQPPTHPITFMKMGILEKSHLQYNCQLSHFGIVSTFMSPIMSSISSL